MRKGVVWLLVLLALPLTAGARWGRAAEAPPNIVVVLADDLGYGDVRCLNPEGKIATPHMDRVASEGMTFTDAHSSSSVCTPTRYGLVTGRYNWRSRLQSGVLGGLSPRLIEADRATIASLLKQQGYHTACLGKWHLGMNWVRTGEVSELSVERPDQVRNVDYAQPISEGPNAVGFDYYYGIAASLDMVPYTFIHNNRVVSLPTEDRAFEWFIGRPERLTRLGPAAPDFDAADVLPVLGRKASEYIRQRAAAAKAGQPFFLYLPLASPHTPILPTPEWLGKSGLNAYADFVMQTDWAVGEVLGALDDTGLADNTLVIVTSDNGCSPSADYAELLAKGHNPSYQFRGHKADIYEGGHRVPFLVRLPGRTAPGTTCDATVCLTDVMATCAELAGAELPDNAGEDSVSLLPLLRGGSDASRREAVVHHSISGAFAIRQGKWKLCLCPGSGGWSAPRPGQDDTSELPRVQLFDLEADLGEQHNLQGEHPEVVAQLTALLEKLVAQGRSTPGEPQQNAVEVDIRRGLNPAGPQRRPAARRQP